MDLADQKEVDDITNILQFWKVYVRWLYRIQYRLVPHDFYFSFFPKWKEELQGHLFDSHEVVERTLPGARDKVWSCFVMALRSLAISGRSI